VADPSAVAEAGYAGMLQGKRIVTPNLTARLMTVSPRVMPRALLARFSKVMQSQVRNPIERQD
jgi:short-subunit dehydrogenase